jgi:hypothetical protein
LKKQSQSAGQGPDVLSAVEWANCRAQLKVEGKMPSARAGETPATQDKANLERRQVKRQEKGIRRVKGVARAAVGC